MGLPGGIIGLEEGWQRVYQLGVQRVYRMVEATGPERGKAFTNKEYMDLYT